MPQFRLVVDAGDAPSIGGSVQAIVAKVLSEKPTPSQTLRDTVPEHIEIAVLTALAKLPADRLASAAEFASALGAAQQSTTISGARRRAAPSARSRLMRVLPWAVAVMLGALLLWQRRVPAATVTTSRQRVVLWKYAFASPVNPGAQRVTADGAPLRAPNLAAASANAGGQNDVLSLSALPKGNGFLFTVCASSCAVGSSVWVYDAAGDSARRLLPQAIGAWYASTGHVVYSRREGGLYAVPFDISSLQVTGGPVALIDDVVPSLFTLSPSGAALYTVDHAKAAPSGLVWVSRDGRAEPVDSAWRALTVSELRGR